MEVASGLDSMVLGEPQTAGQMKDAYAMANENGTIGLLLGKLYQRAFADPSRYEPIPTSVPAPCLSHLQQ